MNDDLDIERIIVSSTQMIQCRSIDALIDASINEPMCRY